MARNDTKFASGQDGKWLAQDFGHRSDKAQKSRGNRGLPALETLGNMTHITTMKTASILLVIATLATGCATAPKDTLVVDHPNDLQSLHAALADRLSQLRIGMSLESFRRLMPEAYAGGQSDATTAYEVAQSQKYVTQDDLFMQNLVRGGGSPRPRTKQEVLWFYFYKDQLVKWGRPQDWPDQPDVILEKWSR